MDYRILNSLLPPVKKAHSKAKGVLTLVPLPKIDEIYARLQGFRVYSMLDMMPFWPSTSSCPIVIIPKRTAPGEPPKQRLCVDYRILNSLLPPVKKAHSKAKGVLTLVPLPKIDEIYARLQGFRVYSMLDMMPFWPSTSSCLFSKTYK